MIPESRTLLVVELTAVPTSVMSFVKIMPSSSTTMRALLQVMFVRPASPLESNTVKEHTPAGREGHRKDAEQRDGGTEDDQLPSDREILRRMSMHVRGRGATRKTPARTLVNVIKSDFLSPRKLRRHRALRSVVAVQGDTSHGREGRHLALLEVIWCG